MRTARDSEKAVVRNPSGVSGVEFLSFALGEAMQGKLIRGELRLEPFVTAIESGGAAVPPKKQRKLEG